MKDELGKRMKNNYESIWKIKLPRRMPLIIRLDGKAFHTFTKNMEKPFDEKFIAAMVNTTSALVNNIQGAQIAYTQSDEISILVHDYKKLTSEAWFDKEIQKIVSISASFCSVSFNNYFLHSGCSLALFDSRVFVLPESEVCNYFIWRQQDCVRNSIQSLAQSLYSHKELYKKNQSELQEMCFSKGHNWNNLAMHLKRGVCCYNQESEMYVDLEIPIFSKNREFIEKWLQVEEC